MKRFFVIIVAALFLLPLLVSCKSEPKNVTSGTSQSDEKTLTIKDLGGREIRVLSWNFGYQSKSILGFTGEILSNLEEEEYSSVDIAKKMMRDKVEEEYNVKITGEVVNGNRTDFTNRIRNMVQSGVQDVDMVFDSVQNLSPLVISNIFYDLNKISTIDFSNTWWDQNAKEDLSINNRLYYMCGDMNTYDNDGTWCILFNKNLLQKLNLNIDLYQLVKDDKWTFDRLTEICKSNKISQDINGDGVQDEKDQWAFGTETYNIFVHVLAGGDKIVKKDSNDIPQFTVTQESVFNTLGKVLEFYNDKDNVMVANAPPYTNKGFENVWEATVHKAFKEGRELFYMCGLINVPSFRNMDDDFGILPVPKMTEDQDRYYHTVSVSNMSALAVPINVEAPDDLGLVIEALGKYAQKYITPAYYDIQLKYRDARDNESSEMLDIIFSSRTFDLGAAFNWGNTLTNLMMMDMNYVSRFESIMDGAQVALEQTLESISYQDQ
jgi:ABC-type glycerol-3-phosphate transport system substrate-binding protein